MTTLAIQPTPEDQWRGYWSRLSLSESGKDRAGLGIEQLARTSSSEEVEFASEDEGRKTA